MSVRRALLPSLVALVLGVATALAVGCGGDRSNLIPASSAQGIKDRLAEVQQAVDGGDCAAAESALARAKAEALALPPSVDRRLRRRINQFVAALEQRVPKDCQSTQTDTQPTDTQPTTTTETTPTTTETTPTVTTPTDTTPTTTTPPSDTTTTPPSDTTTTPTPGTGGTPSGDVPTP